MAAETPWSLSVIQQRRNEENDQGDFFVHAHRPHFGQLLRAYPLGKVSVLSGL